MARWYCGCACGSEGATGRESRLASVGGAGLQRHRHTFTFVLQGVLNAWHGMAWHGLRLLLFLDNTLKLIAVLLQICISSRGLRTSRAENAYPTYLAWWMRNCFDTI